MRYDFLPVAAYTLKTLWVPELLQLTCPWLSIVAKRIGFASGLPLNSFGGIKGETNWPSIEDLVRNPYSVFCSLLINWKDVGETPKELLEAVGHRELAWLQKFGKQRFPREPLYREFYGRQEVDPQVQVDSLRDYLKVAPHIIPENPELCQPTIRHPDLSPNNIFVSESGDITGVIDWQHSTILPMFLQAKIPKHFQNYGDDDSENFRRPELPTNFDFLEESEKANELELYRRRQLHYFYLGFTSTNNKPHFHAMGKHDLIVRNRLYDTAGRPWEGDNTSLKAELVQISTYWPDIATSAMKETNFPVKYPDADVTNCLNIDAKQKIADAQMQQLRDFIGVNIDGWVPTESYEEAREKERYIKQQMLEAAETEDERKELDEHWPFQDHEELD